MEHSLEQRYANEFCARLGNNATETFQKIRDFYLWGYIKYNVFQEPPNSIGRILKERIAEIINGITPDKVFRNNAKKDRGPLGGKTVVTLSAYYNFFHFLSFFDIFFTFYVCDFHVCNDLLETEYRFFFNTLYNTHTW